MRHTEAADTPGSCSTLLLLKRHVAAFAEFGCSSYDFQAPGMYEKAGFERMAEFAEWPEGHSNVVLCKTLIMPDG